MTRCQICGIVPRAFWLFGGTKFWYQMFSDQWLCPSCYSWADRILGRVPIGFVNWTP